MKIVHYELTYSGSYIYPETKPFPRKGDSILQYKSLLDRFHMRSVKTLVFNGEEWCLRCQTCKSKQEEENHIKQIKREEVLNCLITYEN